MTQQYNRVTLSVYQKAKKGNYYCGDSYYYIETEDAFVCALADGLGSGKSARESSKAVMGVVEQNPSLEVDALVRKCNEVLVDKRGVVLGIFKIDFNNETYSYTSIGNIGVITLSSDGSRSRNIPLAGYLAGYPKKMKVIRGEIHKGMFFLMFSDGVNDRKLSAKYLDTRNVNLITEHYKEHFGQSGNDDSTLIAMEYN